MPKSGPVTALESSTPRKTPHPKKKSSVLAEKILDNINIRFYY
jgi:hypothetical protein